MSAGFLFCLALVSAMFWTGFACAFVAARYPRNRVHFLQGAVGCWALALAGLVAWSAA